MARAPLRRKRCAIFPTFMGKPLSPSKYQGYSQNVELPNVTSFGNQTFSFVFYSISDMVKFKLI